MRNWARSLIFVFCSLTPSKAHACATTVFVDEFDPCVYESFRNRLYSFRRNFAAAFFEIYERRLLAKRFTARTQKDPYVPVSTCATVKPIFGVRRRGMKMTAITWYGALPAAQLRRKLRRIWRRLSGMNCITLRPSNLSRPSAEQSTEMTG